MTLPLWLKDRVCFVIVLQIICEMKVVRVGLKSDGTDDGTLSRLQICKPLYGPSTMSLVDRRVALS